MYYIYKERYSEEKNGLNTQDTKKFDKKNWESLVIMKTSL